MTITLVTEPKTKITLSNEIKLSNLTWDNAGGTWDEANFTWDYPKLTTIKETKNNISLNMPLK